MRVWIVCFIILFGAAELLEWLQKLSLPMPIFVLGGAFLAIASNYTKLTHLPFHPDYDAPELPDPEPSTSAASSPPIPPAKTAPAPSRTAAISFEINKIFQPKD